MAKHAGGFIAQLKRRNVIRMAGLYLVAAWLLVQVAETVLPAFDVPGWVLRAVITLLALGFIPALVFAWVFELTPGGLKRDAEVPPEESIGHVTARRMEHMIVVLLTLGLGYFAIDRFMFAPKREAAKVTAARTDMAAKHAAEQAQVAEKSIAVLPFANVGGIADEEYFSDGLSEEMINTLGQLADLKVIGRSSSFQYKGKTEDSRAIGKALGVAYLLEGSVRKAGEKVRIAVQLVRTKDGTAAWSQSYDRELSDIFAVQSEIATTVAKQLHSKLLGTEDKPATPQPDMPPSGNVAAYNAYLQGLFYFRRNNAEDFQRAITDFERALALDPEYALAHARLAITHLLLGNSDSKLADFHTVRRSVARALQLAPDLALAHVARGMLLEYSDSDVHGALREYRRAAALEPKNTAVLRRLNLIHAMFGQLPLAEAGARQAVALDPVDASVHGELGMIFHAEGKLAEAEAAYRKAADLRPQGVMIPAFLAQTVALQGRAGEAVTLAEQEPDPFWRVWGLALVHEVNGQRDKSQPYLDQMIKENADDSAAQIAQVYAARKQPEEMFRWLAHAKKTKDPGMVELQMTPFLIDYKADPRFQALLREYRLLPEDTPADTAIPAIRN